MIKETLKTAIRSLSKKYDIGEKEVRLKIFKTADEEGKYHLDYSIMKNSEILEQTNLATALNLASIPAYMVGNRLNSIIDSLVKEYGIPKSSINVRIYTKTDDCEPLLYLFDGVNAKSPLDINKFI